MDTVYTYAMIKGGVLLLHELEWFCMIANLAEWWTLSGDFPCDGIMYAF